MLKKHSQFFQTILLLMDMFIIGLSWILAYAFRFYAGPIPVLKGIPAIEEFLALLLFLLPTYAIVFKYSGLYEPMRSSARIIEIRKIISASVLSTFIFITLIYLVKEYKYSRLVFAYFLVINTAFLSLFRYSLRIFLGWLRRHGYNLRYVLIVGDGKLAQDVERKLADHAEYGFKILGFLSKDKDSIGKKIDKTPILGTYGDLKKILNKVNVDQLVLALPFEHIRMLKIILGQIYDEMVEIKIVPDLYQYFTLRKGIETLDDLPIISLRESPLYGWNRLSKRLFDIIVSIIVLFLASPLILLIAILIKLFSPGPILYKQRRMGLDGRVFDIIKFRSMKPRAEQETGPVWAKENDKRRTQIGAFLRRYNLDELPQFLNVLKGQMSVVGPRPERPEFMQEFKKKIPEYMLRHKMKAGITGWAQVNGLRGDTSIEERTKYDLYYIENWSILFDFKIFFKSFLATKHAY
jgi:Undecaprenyl-phosphate glucose phosphotransferase